MLFVFLLLMLEAGVTTDVFLNRNWEQVSFSYFYLMTYVVNGLWKMLFVCWFHLTGDQDFPEDPSGSFTQFKDFVRSNFEICKWIGLTIVSVQVSLFLSVNFWHPYEDIRVIICYSMSLNCFTLPKLMESVERFEFIVRLRSYRSPGLQMSCGIKKKMRSYISRTGHIIFCSRKRVTLLCHNCPVHCFCFVFLNCQSSVVFLVRPQYGIHLFYNFLGASSSFFFFFFSTVLR